LRDVKTQTSLRLRQPRALTAPRKHRLPAWVDNPTKKEILEAVKTGQRRDWVLEAFAPHAPNPSQEKLEENARRYFANAAAESNPALARKILSEDATRLSGRKKGERWQPTERRRPTPEDRLDIRRALLLLLSEPTFAGVLTLDEQSLWRLWYDPADFSVKEISTETSVEPRTLYRRHADCVKKLAVCYGQFLESDLPISLQVIKCLYVWDTFGNSNYAEFCGIIRGAESSSNKASDYRKILDEMADSTPGGIAVRGGGQKERAYGTPKKG
jgi:hypothetical protein